MMEMEKKIADEFIKAERLWIGAFTGLHFNYEVTGDSRVFLRVVENLYKSLYIIVEQILKLEYVKKRGKLFKEKRDN